MSSKHSVFVFVVVASSWLACGDLLDLGPRPERWPPEAGASPEIGSSDATRPVVEASNEDSNSRPPPDVPTIDLPETAAPPPLDADLSLPAVGFVTGISSPVAPTHPGATDRTNERMAASMLSCSGVLIASRTVLTAASCLASDPLQTYFALNPTGDALAHPDRTMVYAIDGAHLSPGGQAVLHLAVASDQPEPASVAAPLPPVTANDSNASPFGWHSTSSPARLLENGGSPTLTASWRIESATTVVRRIRSGGAVLLGDAGLEFSVPTPPPLFSSDLGAPALEQNGGLVVGSLLQSAPSALTFLSTFAVAEGSWLEQMLWLYDDVVVPNVALPPPPGGYAWMDTSNTAQDPLSLHNVPNADFYAAGSEMVTGPSDSGTRALGMCITWTGGAQLPGKYWSDGGCAFDSNGGEVWASVFKVLRVTGAASWSQAPGGAVATGSFAAGYVGMTPLFACRASYMTGVHPGFVRAGSCYITWGGRERVLSAFETLVLGP